MYNLINWNNKLPFDTRNRSLPDSRPRQPQSPDKTKMTINIEVNFFDLEISTKEGI